MEIKEMGLDGVPGALSGSNRVPGVPLSVLPECLLLYPLFPLLSSSHAEFLQGI